MGWPRANPAAARRPRATEARETALGEMGVWTRSLERGRPQGRLNQRSTRPSVELVIEAQSWAAAWWASVALVTEEATPWAGREGRRERASGEGGWPGGKRPMGSGDP